MAPKPRKRTRKTSLNKHSRVAAKTRKNKDAQSKSLSPTDFIDDGQPTPQSLKKGKEDVLPKRRMPDPDRHFKSVEDEVAQNTHHMRNWYWPDAAKHYPKPWQERMRRVTKYYPYAEGGPLAVDLPGDAQERKECEEKRKIFQTDKKLKGIRYAVVLKNHELADVLQQIGEA